MDLTVKDVARILKVPANTVYRWINEGELPMQSVNDQHYIHRAELLEWATVHKMDVGPEIFRDEHGSCYSPVRLSQSFQAGGIHYDVPGTEKSEVLKHIVETLPVTNPGERADLLDMFLARESIGTTAIGKGIAIPHPRRPIVLPVAASTVSLFFLKTPISFGAADGELVQTVFALVAPTVKAHLHLLARISFALQDAGFLEAVERRAPPEELFAQARRVEDSFDRLAVKNPAGT